MDEQQDEDEEILSQRSGTTLVEIEEEKFTDNRSIQGDNDIDMMPQFYYCTSCKQTHFTKCFETLSGCSEGNNQQFTAFSSKQSQQYDSEKHH